MSFMLQNCYAEIDGKPRQPLCDLGYTKDAESKFTALREFGISIKNFRREGFDRLLVRIPPTKLAAVMKAFPIVEGKTYFQCTHYWKEVEVA